MTSASSLSLSKSAFDSGSLNFLPSSITKNLLQQGSLSNDRKQSVTYNATEQDCAGFKINVSQGYISVANAINYQQQASTAYASAQWRSNANSIVQAAANLPSMSANECFSLNSPTSDQAVECFSVLYQEFNAGDFGLSASLSLPPLPIAVLSYNTTDGCCGSGYFGDLNGTYVFLVGWGSFDDDYVTGTITCDGYGNYTRVSTNQYATLYMQAIDDTGATANWPSGLFNQALDSDGFGFVNRPATARITTSKTYVSESMFEDAKDIMKNVPISGTNKTYLYYIKHLNDLYNYINVNDLPTGSSSSSSSSSSTSSSSTDNSNDENSKSSSSSSSSSIPIWDTLLMLKENEKKQLTPS
ncbi:hypothetical protein Gasu2_34060 [Galdieria sulphuraria]|uniref:Uncharacterized protein n=1 Tax=Galdieria sulphuraria TaxID=130081 RepID=M2WQS4_GALSU|nr:uncharacterized protein Gasu_62100 [Galdieria sulphuraria]EME26145.1 hypothetical protein Gasu_62100 [Galdieria sulphuraria]GJD09136.1 hypothetical protein Gasu2_34060 [Galdieria sulphuraria]|eukprot:XP_005702665.1 hypothetical protein Gasu_62100 [Galdieria sulphuraria]